MRRRESSHPRCTSGLPVNLRPVLTSLVAVATLVAAAPVGTSVALPITAVAPGKAGERLVDSPVLALNADKMMSPHMRRMMRAMKRDEAASPVLDSEDFYADCRQLLTAQGSMTVNLFGRDMSYKRSLQHIAQAFSDQAVWAFKPTREGNSVVVALRTPAHPSRDQLTLQAEQIEHRWPSLPASRWVRALSSVS